MRSIVPPPDAVAWHTKTASDFSAAYARSQRFRERLAVWDKYIRANASIGRSVLDAGCGPGYLAAIAASTGSAVTAFDGSSAMIKIAQARLAKFSQSRTLVGRLENISEHLQNSYDVIICSSVLEYVDDLGACLSALAHLLKPEGTLLVSMPNGDSPYRFFETLAFRLARRPRYRKYVRHIPSVNEFRRELLRAGLTVIRTESYAAAPLVGRLLHSLGFHLAGDTLVIFEARRS